MEVKGPSLRALLYSQVKRKWEIHQFHCTSRSEEVHNTLECYYKVGCSNITHKMANS